MNRFAESTSKIGEKISRMFLNKENDETDGYKFFA